MPLGGANATKGLIASKLAAVVRPITGGSKSKQ